MKKLWVIAVALTSTMAWAQHDQKQTPATESKSSQDSKTKTSHSSYSNNDEGTIEGTYKITFTAKNGSPVKDNDQTGMNASERMNSSNATSNQYANRGQAATSMQSNSGTATSQNRSSQYNTSAPVSTMGTSTSQSPPPEYNSDGTKVTGQQGTANQNMGNTPGQLNQPEQSGKNSILGNPSAAAMQNNNTAAMDYSALAGKQMVLTLKSGNLNFCEKEKSRSENKENYQGNKSNGSTSKSDVSDKSSSMSASDNTAEIKNCQYTKTSGQGPMGTITASCGDNSSNKSYWNAYIDESKIEGSVSFVTAGTGTASYSFTGTRIAGSGSKKTSKETSQR